MNYVFKNNSTWSGKGDPGITHSRSFSTRIPHPEVLSSLCRISHSCPNFGESRFPGAVKSRIPLEFSASRTDTGNTPPDPDPKTLQFFPP